MDKVLGELLLKRGLIAKEKLQAALLEQTVTKERLGKVLVRNGFIRQDALFRLMREINPNSLHDESVFENIIPAEILIETRTMIVALLEDTLYLSTLSSPQLVRRRIAPYVARYKVAFTAANPVRMQEYLSHLRGSGEEDMLSWEKIFYDAMRAKASDIHIFPRHAASYTVETRIDGVLNLTHEGPRDEYISLVSRVKDLAKMDMAERRRPQDGGFSMDYSGRVVNFRVTTVPTIHGERMVVRILDPDSANRNLEELGITRVDLWRRAVARPDGLALVCGPTGSGKTTTLSATGREMNFLERAIYSAEDPVENDIPYAGLVNINPSVGLTYPVALRNFMRADPDVIIIGELRDLDTARIALSAGETGHLALGTLHVGSILQAIGRLRDLGIQPFELMHLLRGIMVQRLMRIYCLNCHGKGCSMCGHTGYKGREVVSEVACFDTEADVQAVIDGKVTWQTIQQNGKQKVLEGKTSEAEFFRVFGISMSDVQ
ncbi:GspE/PulE family protein [Burkholderia ubonensis]|uniref:GspE/PulE family protein n=1 Tax=Burkholderia ubonensis TaxID=101571 RepID=UPI0007C669E4|nr:ATPase, T2SS/T4P/T4SS family [Burkholderia ubonensis]